MDRASGPSTTLCQPARRDVLRVGCWALASTAAFGWPQPSRAEPAPKRVLIVHSFGREFAPFDDLISVFRRELARLSNEPIVFLEAALDAVRAIEPAEQAAFVAYLRARFAQPAPDLIVSSGAPAGQFALRYREALFPGVPILLTALDARFVAGAALRPGDGAVGTSIDLPAVLKAIVRVLPNTRTIAVVVGDSALERFWRKEIERAGTALTGQVELAWFDGLSLAQMKERIAKLPPASSAVLYGLLIVDAAGVPHERLEALAELRQSEQVPIFSAFENELGKGVVGGPYLAQSRAGRETARIAARLLSGAGTGEPVVTTIGMEAPAYDWRELRRWQIDESRLPPSSEVRFRAPPPWVEYRKEIGAITAVIVAQAALIASLLVQRAQRRRAEREARTLGGRLITAYEDAGRRMARELHDDVTQRLAGLSIEAATLSRLAEPAARSAAEQAISSELAGLSRDVHALSYRLHPTVIDDLGLEEALRIECGRLTRQGEVGVDFEAEPAGEPVRGERALCLFRVAQEALRNVVRHAGATHIRVKLGPDRGGTTLSVVDDGHGFDPAAERDRPSLGLASMRERVALLGGNLQVQSRRGRGTSVTAWLPAGGST